MRIFRKITIQNRKYRVRKIYFCGMPVLQYIKIRKHKKYKKIYSLVKKQKPKEGQRVFYLKVHRVHKTAVDCIAHWLDVINLLKGFVYFICDNSEMEKLVLQHFSWYNQNFEIIKSDRKSIKKEISAILNDIERKNLWQRIAYAMTTAFVHAEKNNYPLSYNIDADDIYIYADAQKIADAFIKAEEYALKNNLDVFNLDMFVSKSFGVHWSFGVVLCTNPRRCLDVIKQNTDWKKNDFLINKYKTNYIKAKEFNFNVDWLFTWFKDTKLLNMGTFYINNAMVVHMPDYVLEHGWAFMFQWINGILKFPILDTFYDLTFYTEDLRTIPIHKSVVKIDVNIAENEYREIFMKQYYWSIYGQVNFQAKLLNYALIQNKIDRAFYDKFLKIKKYPGYVYECEDL